MALSVLVLIVYRRQVAREEDDSLHVMDAAAVPHQEAVAHKLEAIDKWGKTLTILTVAAGIAIAAVYFYQLWVTTSTTIQG
jgi:hypothetical protein